MDNFIVNYKKNINTLGEIQNVIQNSVNLLNFLYKKDNKYKSFIDSQINSISRSLNVQDKENIYNVMNFLNIQNNEYLLMDIEPTQNGGANGDCGEPCTQDNDCGIECPYCINGTCQTQTINNGQIERYNPNMSTVTHRNSNQRQQNQTTSIANIQQPVLMQLPENMGHLPENVQLELIRSLTSLSQQKMEIEAKKEKRNFWCNQLNNYLFIGGLPIVGSTALAYTARNISNVLLNPLIEGISKSSSLPFHITGSLSSMMISLLNTGIGYVSGHTIENYGETISHFGSSIDTQIKQSLTEAGDSTFILIGILLFFILFFTMLVIKWLSNISSVENIGCRIRRTRGGRRIKKTRKKNVNKKHSKKTNKNKTKKRLQKQRNKTKHNIRKERIQKKKQNKVNVSKSKRMRKNHNKKSRTRKIK